VRYTLVSWILASAMLNSLPPAAAAAAPSYRQRGPYEVATLIEDWTDAARNRPVPAKVYYPKDAPGPLPAIVFSHGLGGSRAGYAYLGEHWASHGYVSVHVQHKGSDSEVWQQAQRKDLAPAMRAAAQDVTNAVNRPRDIRFAIDQLQKLHREHPQLKGRLDLDRVGAAGHSFGAYTALAAAGLKYTGPFGRETSLGDPRVRAFIAMSPPGPKRKDGLDALYAGIRVPGLHMTGTKDTSPIGLSEPADRRIPFDHVAAADQHLVIFREGDHMVFSGRAAPGSDRPRDAVLQPLILESTTAFWDAYLKRDPKAKAWLTGGGWKAALGDNATLEQKGQAP
jgi:predicted dienelactone hydrolase